MIEQVLIWGMGLNIITIWICYWIISRQWKKEQTGLETFKMWAMKKARENVEQRCQHCQEKAECPAYNSGVVYPCQHYKERERDGTEE